MRIVAGNQTMLLVELESIVDPGVNQQAIELARRLHARHLNGVRDVVPAYCSVAVHFDPLSTDLVALERAIRHDAERGIDEGAADVTESIVEIPVRYGGDDGPDLEAVARWAGCSAAEVIARHSAREYRVYMLGFVGGFSYMGTVDPRIAAPRHRTPRERVPVGSVGIAGAQTGVYPLATPGGWQLVGRTDVKMFDLTRTPPNLLAAGHRVRFIPVSRSR